MTHTSPGTPGWLRVHNDRAALRLMLEGGPLTRTRLGELTGLSKPTSAQVVTRLEKAGFIQPVGEVSAGRGPSAITYGARGDQLFGVAIDIRSASIAATVVDALDRDWPIVTLVPETGERSPENDVAAAIEAACRAAGVPPHAVGGAIVGVQAAVGTNGDEITFTDTLPGWPVTGARSRIEDEVGVEILLENDVNLATVAERALGAARDAASFTLLWLGDGVGAGLDFDGEVHRGAKGGAGEIGYLPIPRVAEGIVPGAEDITDLLGGPAVLAILGAERDAVLADWLPALAADERALDMLADRIAVGVVPVLALLDPMLVVLGGPTGLAAGPALAAKVSEQLEGLAARLSRRVADAAGWRPAVRAGEVVDEPVLAGARSLLRERLRDRLIALVEDPDAPAAASSGFLAPLFGGHAAAPAS